MYRRLMTATVVLGLSLATSGCQQQRQMQADLMNLQQSVPKQFQLLKQQNEFLNRKVNTLNEKVEELTKANSTLSEELATYANRPDEVKIEIIKEVNTRFAAIAKAQSEFEANVTQTLDSRNAEITEKLDTEFADMNKVLDHHTAFVKFVASQQDSINRVFANRMDSRPWYESIIGKWDDRERAEATSDTP